MGTHDFGAPARQGPACCLLLPAALIDDMRPPATKKLERFSSRFLPGLPSTGRPVPAPGRVPAPVPVRVPGTTGTTTFGDGHDEHPSPVRSRWPGS